MGGATIWPVPRAVDAEAHYYPRRWKRNFLFLYTGMFLIGIQVQRYAQLCRVSLAFLLDRATNRSTLADSFSSLFYSNRPCAQESTWIGVAATPQSASATTTSEELQMPNWDKKHSHHVPGAGSAKD